MRALLLLLLAACTPPGGEDGGVTSDSATPAPDPAAGTIRIATFNIESVGAPGSDQYVALAQVLARIDADVVGVNEVDELENDALAGLAMELGYDTVQVPQTNPFGALHNAILTRLEVVEATTHTSPSLSGDQAANDLTRWPVSVTLAGSGITVVTNHCKAGFDDIDEFRRTVDAIRTAQAPAVMDRAIVMGDLNHYLLIIKHSKL